MGFGQGIGAGLERLGEGFANRRERHRTEQAQQAQHQSDYLREVLRIAAEQGDSETIGKLLGQYGQFQTAPAGKKGAGQREAAFKGTQGLIEAGRTVMTPRYTGPTVDPETHTVGGGQERPRTAMTPVSEKRPLFKTRDEMTQEDAKAAGMKAAAVSKAQQPGREELERIKGERQAHLKELDLQNKMQLEATRHQYLMSKLGADWGYRIAKPTMERAYSIAQAKGKETPDEEDRHEAAKQLNDEWEMKLDQKQATFDKTRQSIELAQKQMDNIDSLIAHRQAQSASKFPPNVKFALDKTRGEMQQLQRVIDERSKFVDEHFSDPNRQQEIQQAYATINEKKLELERKAAEASQMVNQYGQGQSSATPPAARAPGPQTRDKAPAHKVANDPMGIR
jgi:hypothetical protein